MSYYQPIFRNQIGDPTTTRDGFICTMSSGAMVLDYHTHGAIQVWGGDLERHQNDHVGGTDLYDLALAWKWYGQTLTQGTGGWAGVKSALGGGKAVVLQGDYDPFIGADSCQAGFDDPHAIALIPSTTAWALVGDPLCRSYKVIAEAKVRAYAEKLNPRVQWAASRAQPQSVAVGMTLYIAPYTKLLVARISPAGCIAGWDTVQWGAKASSAPCNAPVIKKGCISGSALVAEVTVGPYAGKFLRVGQGVTVS